MKLLLERAYLPTSTMGVLSAPGCDEFYTIEKPWKDNIPFESCIPEGTYECTRYHSARFPNVWKINGVVDRSDILIHVGNFAADVVGCVAVGKGMSESRQMVTGSKAAITDLRSKLPGKFSLTIKTKTP